MASVRLYKPGAILQKNIRGAPDLDPDPAGYPVFFQDPVGSGSGRIQKY